MGRSFWVTVGSLQVRLGGRNGRVGGRDTTLLVLKMEEGPGAQEHRRSPAARKGKGMCLPQGPQREHNLLTP